MTEVDERARYATVTAGARVFALIVLAAPVAFTGDYGPIVNVILVAAVWLAAVFVEGLHRVPVMPALVIEASLVTFLAAITLADSAVLLPAMAIPLFVAGLVRGSQGMLEVLGAVLVVLAASLLPNGGVTVDAELLWLLFTWVMVGVGVGAMAAIVHNLRTQEPGIATSYRDARDLIMKLQDLSGELVDGLDPVSISQNILFLAREELPLTGAVVYAGTPDTMVPLVEGDVTITEDESREAVVGEVVRTGRPVKLDSRVGFPLSTEAGLVGVVAGSVHPAFPGSHAAVEASLTDLVRKLGPEAVQLDTALIFSSVRNEATAEERRRLARDLHDGVAQDLAALGYLIDGIGDSATDADQSEQVDELRDELSRVVAELRRSIFSLRNESTTAMTLGESIQALADHISSRSGIPVDVVLDEGSTRLRPDVEAELLRIAQEGMNNAVKHSRASRIRVACAVHPPYARVRVIDNGRGLQPGRDDSHGLRIMRERARRIGADLSLVNPEGRPGTELSVEIGTRPADNQRLDAAG